MSHHSLSESQPINNHHEQGSSKVKEFALGLGMLGAVAGGGYLVANGDIDPMETIYALSLGDAEASTATADALDVTINLGAILGAAILAKRGGQHLANGLSESRRAQNKIAHASSSNKNGYVKIGGVSALMVVAGTTLGNLADIGHSVGSSQADVVDAIGDAISEAVIIEGDNGVTTQFLITNTANPELANNAFVPDTVVNGLVANADDFGIAAIPARWEWHSALKGDGSTKQQVLAASLPAELTGLESASTNCDVVNVNVASELNLSEGDTFDMDGLKLTVRGVLDEASGAGLLPIIFNNEDFARCVDGNEDQPYSVVFAQGERDNIQAALTATGYDGSDISKRAFIVPFEEFQAETQQTGENVSYPYIIQAIAESMLFVGAALSGRAASKISEKRRLNIVSEANGMSKRMIAKQANEVAESEAVKSSLVAAPLIFIADAVTSGGVPGAEIGPTATTILFVLGATAAAGKLGSAIAMRREAPKLNLGKGHAL